MRDDLAHFGIPGMKWGRGKARRTSSKSKPKNKPRIVSDDHKKKVLLKGKKIHEMSNEQLRELTTRIQLEKQVRDLNPGHVKKGLNVVKTITAAGTTLASFYALSKTPLAQEIIKGVKSKVK